MKAAIIQADPRRSDALHFDLKAAGFEVYLPTTIELLLNDLSNQNPDFIIIDTATMAPDSKTKTATQFLGALPDKKFLLIVITPLALSNLEDFFDQGAEAIFNFPYIKKDFIQSLTSLHERSKNSISRKPDRVDALYKVVLKEPPLETEICNIARGGVFINMKNPPFEIGDEISFDIIVEHPAPKQIHCKGLVRWKRKYDHLDRLSGIGVEFCDLSSSSRESIAQLINAQITLAYIPAR